MGCVSTECRNEATRLVIIGGGPGGYEAAIGAAQLGANVTIVERAGMGGSAVLTDVVPSKTLIATADVVRRAKHSSSFGVKIEGLDDAETDFAVVNHRLLDLAKEQSADIRNGLERAGVRILIGEGRLLDAHTVEVTGTDGSIQKLDADAVLLATGAHPRELPTAKPDGERIFNWTQIYNMNDVPEHLIVIGSGVTGAEFASAYNLLGAKVTLVSSRDRVLPGEDADAAGVLEDVFKRNGLNVVSQARAEAVTRQGDKVLVTLADGRVLEGSHCLVAVGSIPNTKGLGLEEAGVQLTDSGHIRVDGVSRTTANNVYAAGDCTGVFNLASVSAMQGRIAVAHLLGDSVKPINLDLVSSNIFTSPEIATVGVSQRAVAEGKYQANIVKVDLATNARAKMMNMEEGFVKIVSRKGSGTVIGGVVVAPRASELIYSLALAVQNNLHVDDVAETFTVYPSLAGSLAEAARRLHRHM
ncbi:NAD(P)H dehydrogenase (quinone) [Glutamicibacter creatinolyticus]|uniref:NAD(P)H dehydrogenase (quinone) n=1 Tax=Glutamicibacter creatinolyticus TaxID=162496 RepID=A0A5B7WQX9_9MICC|nr:NAD(P)H-quinone dehydrogenase [Glutamicibacter creatinolyticus]QCY46418.1 NAD(P)H dehydrogenase (quinone) [Glutamicibacter creatinolyticus]